jgi:type IV secretory pathway VirD2 relaxase
MSDKSDDHGIKSVLSRQPKKAASVARREAKAGSKILKMIHSIRLTSPRAAHAAKKSAGRALVQRRAGSARFMQRAAIRMSYSKNEVPGQWAAFGRYIQRDSATQQNQKGEAFDANHERVNAAHVMNNWQKAGDEHVFKFILSPEFGDRHDMRAYTRDVVKELERDLGTKLEWVAADHYNTDDPHVHLAVRGVDERGHTLRIPREYVRQQLRQRTSEVATRHIGLRTDLDVAEAFDRQIKQQRFTDLDRRLLKSAAKSPDGMTVDFTSAIAARAAKETKDMRLREIRRLAHLESMGLATQVRPMCWQLDAGLENVLRQRQIADDRLKTMYSARQVLSDPRLQLVATDLKTAGRVAGRLVGTGLDERTDRAYMLVESTDGRVHYLYQPKSAQAARNQGLAVGDFVVVDTKASLNNKQQQALKTSFSSYGDAQACLSDRKHLAGQAFAHVERTGTLPPVQPWGGWLGQYQQALRHRADELVQRGAIELGSDGRYTVRQKLERGI